jgi:hypothetical protein
MKNIVKLSNMVGYYSLPSAYFEDSYFDHFAMFTEKRILRGDGVKSYGLLGDEEYVNLLADLDSNGNPQTQKYIDLINGVNYVNNSSRNIVFSGIKEMLNMFVYTEYVRRNAYQQSRLNQIKPNSENAEKSTLQEIFRDTSERYNEAVRIYNYEAYNYILFKQADFPKWLFTKKYEELTKGLI